MRNLVLSSSHRQQVFSSEAPDLELVYTVFDPLSDSFLSVFGPSEFAKNIEIQHITVRLL